MIINLAFKATVLSSLVFNAYASLLPVDVKEDEIASVPASSLMIEETMMDSSSEGNNGEDVFFDLGKDLEYDPAEEDFYLVGEDDEDLEGYEGQDGEYNRAEEDFYLAGEDNEDLEGYEGLDEDGNVAIYIDRASYTAKYFNISGDTNPSEVLDLSTLEGKNGSLRERKLSKTENAIAVIQIAIDLGNIILQNIGDTSADDANFYVTTGNTRYADGDSMGIAYHLNSGRRDNDSLHFYGRAQTKGSREDLNSWDRLMYVELYFESHDDICINSMTLSVARQPSGTGKREEITIPSWLLRALTGAVSDGYSRTSTDSGICVWFGDSPKALTNFKFRWSRALYCHKSYGRSVNTAQQYFECFRGAMVQHDLYYSSGIRRTDWSRNPPPKFNVVEKKWINLKQSGLCVGIDGRGRHNGKKLILEGCNGNQEQQWYYDSLGRLENRFSGKCLEFGYKDVLYAKAFIWTCGQTKHQQWDQLDRNGKYRNKAFTSKFLGVAYCGQRNDKRSVEARNYEKTGVCNCGQTWNRRTDGCQ